LPVPLASTSVVARTDALVPAAGPASHATPRPMDRATSNYS